MYTLSFWSSLLGIAAVDLSHQEYPTVMLDPRAINKSAGLVSRSRNLGCTLVIFDTGGDARIPPGIRPIIFNGAVTNFRDEFLSNPIVYCQRSPKAWSYFDHPYNYAYIKKLNSFFSVCELEINRIYTEISISFYKRLMTINNHRKFDYVPRGLRFCAIESSRFECHLLIIH